MSTPAPSLDDLRQAAVTASTPEPTPIVPAVPEPIAAPDPWQVKTVDGGNYEVQIEGQVFKGTHQQVLNELAKAQYHATKTIKETRTQFDEFKASHQPAPVPVTPATQTEAPEVIAARQYLADETAKALGFKDANELRQGIQRMNGVVENNSQNDLVSGFFNMVPDFPDNKETVETLMTTAETNGLPMTPQGLRAAHFICVAEKKYEPLTADQIRVQQAKSLGIDIAGFNPPTPAPMVPSTSGVGTQGTFNPFDPKVPLDKVREWAMNAPR